MDLLSKVQRFTDAARREKLASPKTVQRTKAVRFPTYSPGIRIFQVQSITNADGVYNCYAQLSSGLWGTTNYEVLNLHENNTLSDYTPMLAFEDTVIGWQGMDENGTVRWVAIPNVPDVRMARTTEAAPADTKITCNLIAADGETEITSGLGSAIEVHVKSTLNANMDEASSRFANGEYLFAQNTQGKWWYVTTMQASENKVCQ